jgi:hypothetical protein
VRVFLSFENSRFVGFLGLVDRARTLAVRIINACEMIKNEWAVDKNGQLLSNAGEVSTQGPRKRDLDKFLVPYRVGDGPRSPPDVAATFPPERTVNDALRSLIEIARNAGKAPKTTRRIKAPRTVQP